MQLQESGEMYLEAILVLSKKLNRVRSIDVCEFMSFSKPSVSRAVGRLKADGYITVDNDGYIDFTLTGRKIAEKIFERHNILTAFLEKLGVEHSIASADACKMEHDISDITFEKIKQFTLDK